MSEQSFHRYEELNEIETSGILAYPYSFEINCNSIDAKKQFENKELTQSEEPINISQAGRIVAIRKMGKASFVQIQDTVGRIQIYLKKDDLQNYDMLRLLDLGDIIGVKGYLFRTKTGEISIHSTEFELLTKCLVPLPVAKEEIDEAGNKIVYDAFTDKEQRYRQRYLDLNINYDVRDVFRKRAKIISCIRSFMDRNDWLEVETPVLHNTYGGAAARPFGTHLNALDIPLFMRISLELNLKKLIVGGFDGVYEIGKNFRNEGIDKTHNPEFTMMELYVAYKDYNWMMIKIEELLSEVALKVNGSTTVKYKGIDINFAPPYRKVCMLDLISEKIGHDVSEMNVDEIRKIAQELGVQTNNSMGKGKLIDEIFSEVIQPDLIQPTFVMDQPLEMVPLAKKHRTKNGLVEAWDLFINGQEIGPCFSELNDPRDQRSRFEEQLKLRADGDDEAMLIDEDFLNALEVGLPPTAGVGIGIDRLTILLTGQDSIRDVIFYPMMRSL
ncbi:MAG: lysine--tRNA ligase [Chlorobiota bacterium]|nr:lysine--tRNA ligase [Chlorobiota bacterium]QQS65696.1 MAG: lysine--tRNA ligase [Chlorobiota bacterium]